MPTIQSSIRFPSYRQHRPYGTSGLRRSRLAPGGPSKDDLQRLIVQSGLYMVIGDHPTYGARSLLYIGRTSDFHRRLNGEHKWIAKEWRVEVYLGVLNDPAALDDAESLPITPIRRHIAAAASIHAS